MPREKLVSKGVEALSMAELLALVLNTGTQRENVIELCARLVKEYGDGAVYMYKKPKSVVKKFGVTFVKACQIVAVTEIGKRLYLPNPRGAPLLRRPKEVFEYLVELRQIKREQAVCLYLNTRNRLIYKEIIAVGSVDEVYIHPREVFAPAVELRASRVILAHNHPDGNAKPSRSDIELTKRLQLSGRLLGIPLVDHIIVTKNSYYSLSEAQDG